MASAAKAQAVGSRVAPLPPMNLSWTAGPGLPILAAKLLAPRAQQRRLMHYHRQSLPLLPKWQLHVMVPLLVTLTLDSPGGRPGRPSPRTAAPT